MIAKLDDDCIRFVKFVLIDLINKLAESEIDSDVVLPPSQTDAELASFTFDDITPNIANKVIWDTDKNRWKVTYQTQTGTTTRYTDKDDNPLSVADHLDSEQFMRSKHALYRAALLAWNFFDKSKRYRITLPTVVTLDTTPSSPGSRGDIQSTSPDTDWVTSP